MACWVAEYITFICETGGRISGCWHAGLRNITFLHVTDGSDFLAVGMLG